MIEGKKDNNKTCVSLDLIIWITLKKQKNLSVNDAFYFIAFLAEFLGKIT